MDLSAEEQQSDSPLVERIWHSRSDEATPFISNANPQWSIVVSRYQNTTTRSF